MVYSDTVLFKTEEDKEKFCKVKDTTIDSILDPYVKPKPIIPPVDEDIEGQE